MPCSKMRNRGRSVGAEGPPFHIAGFSPDRQPSALVLLSTASMRILTRLAVSGFTLQIGFKIETTSAVVISSTGMLRILALMRSISRMVLNSHCRFRSRKPATSLYDEKIRSCCLCDRGALQPVATSGEETIFQHTLQHS